MLRLGVRSCAFIMLFCAAAAGADAWRAPTADRTQAPPARCAAEAPRSHYPVCEDQVAAFAAALDKARAAGKLLVIEFGATWCPQCTLLHRRLPTADVLGARGPELDFAQSFDLIAIGVSTTDRGREATVASGDLILQQVLAAAPGAELRGWPFLAVIDPSREGKAFTRNTGDLLVGEQAAQAVDAARLRSVLRDAYHQLRRGVAPAPEPKRGLLARMFRSLVGERWGR